MDIAQQISEYIKYELTVLPFILYIVAEFVKSTKRIDLKYIPVVLGIIGVFFAGLYIFATSPIGNYQDILLAMFTSFVQGLLCAGGSVYMNQIIKQSEK